MPKVKIDKVVSFSTEDPVHVAANLLSADPAKKWKCAKPGEKSCSIVLQLEKASIITSIDIGNEHSAYIEVLANRSSGDPDYKVLLVMSSFMSPLESRQSQNINKVRMFSRDQLSKPECEQKWDLIKIVCTQPFNKHVQYGLSFITLHATEEKNVVSNPTTFGKYSLRPDSPDNIAIGSLFARRKELEMGGNSNTPKKAAAAIRDASLNPSTPTNKRISIKKPTSSSKQVNPDESEQKNRNRNEIMYTEEDDIENEKIDRLIELKRKQDAEAEEKQKKLEAEQKKKKDAETKKKKDEAELKRRSEEEAQIKKKKEEDELKRRNEEETQKKKEAEMKKREAKERRNEKAVTPVRKTIEQAGSSTKQNDEVSRKRKSDDFSRSVKKQKIVKNTKPFGELLNGVTLVISGIQNPERGNIRTQALSMGAKYKPVWDDRTCTHLICAFMNTPKFNQVKGKGKIVTKKWILDGYSQRKRLPWRRYALDPSDQKKDESEDEIEETMYESPTNATNNGGSDTEDEIERIRMEQRKESNKKPSPNKARENARRLFDDDEINDNKDKRNNKRGDKNNQRGNYEDVELISDNEEINSTNNNKMEVDDVEDAKKDLIEVKVKKNGRNENYCKLPKLHTFFENKTFFLDENLSEDVKKRLNKYIVAYKGTVLDDITEAEHIISEEDCVEELKGKYSVTGLYSLPDWVWDCHNNKKLMPMEDFVL